jgi:sec-independent protein translocase protein TatA
MGVVLANILGPDAVIILVLVVVLLFGASRLPKLARSIGEASKEFKTVHDETKAAEPAAIAPPPGSANPALPDSEDAVTLTRAELDALLAEREQRARQKGPAGSDR